MKNPQFSFSKGNAKIGPGTLTFSLPAGHTCPFAQQCLAKANQKTGKITDGPKQEFRCFSASSESAFPSVRKSRWKNLRLVKKYLKEGKLAQELVKAIPEKTVDVRIHVGGDFFSQAYFDAWIQVALILPKTIFYAYTKSLPYWAARSHTIPTNFRLTASMGGKADSLADELLLPSVSVIFHPKEAQGLEIDHDDRHAKAAIRRNFALLIHGPQQKGSKASKAIGILKAEHIEFGYSKKKAA